MQVEVVDLRSMSLTSRASRRNAAPTVCFPGLGDLRFGLSNSKHPTGEDLIMRHSSLLLLCVATICSPGLAQDKTMGSVERIDASFDKLVPLDAKIEVLGGGFKWTEGPVWMKAGGYLLFSDIPNNRINRWKEGEGITVFMERSGYTGTAPFTGEEPGTNGLMLDSRGRLCMCEHGNRRVTRLNADGSKTILADRFEGKRFNSPNDLVWHSNGDLYFTDPPYGLPKRYDDPARELDWCGVYRLGRDQKVTLLTKEMTRPNGIGFSPDEKTLYVAQSDSAAAIWKAFPVKEDGTLGEGNIFYDATHWMGKEGRPGAPDGMAVDTAGNVWATGPGGVLVFTSEGKLIGRISTGERTANCCFGDADGSTLYMAADDYVCRIKTNAKGLGF